MAKIRANDHYVPAVADPLSPTTFVNKINVPVFMACQWTDEQTGGHCPDLADRFTGTPRKWFTFTNGTHVDSLDPEIFNRWYDFLQLYVARQAPIVNSAAIHAAAPVIYQEAMGITGVTMPPDPIQLQPTYSTALTAFERPPSIRILFDSGAGGAQPGHPAPVERRGRASRSRELRPGRGISGQTARSATASPRGGSRVVHLERHARPLTNFTGDTAGGPGGCDGQPPYQWTQSPPGSAVLSDKPAERQHDGDWRRRRAPLGPLLHSKCRSSSDDQRGQARRQGDLRAERLGASQRAQARRRQEHAAGARPESQGSRRIAHAAQPLRRGHDPALLRQGPPAGPARVRVTIAAPNGDQPIWSRETDPTGTATVSIAHPSRCRPRSSCRWCRASAFRPTPAVSGSQGRAVPQLPAVREPHGDAYRLARRARTGRRTCSSFLRPDSGKGCPARLAPAGSRGRRALSRYCLNQSAATEKAHRDAPARSCARTARSTGSRLREPDVHPPLARPRKRTRLSWSRSTRGDGGRRLAGGARAVFLPRSVDRAEVVIELVRRMFSMSTRRW